MTIIQLINSAGRLLREKGIETARLDAEVLLAHVMGIERAGLYTTPGGVDERTVKLFETYIRRRAERCPVAYITGVKEFWSASIRVTPDVMIPRPETELIVELVLKFHPPLNPLPSREGNIDFEILDLCCGSGCISAALAHEIPRAHFTLTDKSEAAIEVARENLAFAEGRVKFICGDLFEKVEGKFGLIVSNPPYGALTERDSLSREILEYEPQMAIFGGKDGLDFIRRIIKDAPRFLKSGGRLIMEIGIGQAGAVTEFAQKTGVYDGLAVHRDLAGIERVITLWTNS